MRNILRLLLVLIIPLFISSNIGAKEANNITADTAIQLAGVSLHFGVSSEHYGHHNRHGHYYHQRSYHHPYYHHGRHYYPNRYYRPYYQHYPRHYYPRYHNSYPYYQYGVGVSTYIK